MVCLSVCLSVGLVGFSSFLTLHDLSATMLLRNEYAETDLSALHAFIQENPLGIFTTGIPSPYHPFLQSSHIPWILDASQGDKPGVLRGHIARQNPQTKSMIHSLSQPDSNGAELPSQVLILFNSPVAHYVTPKFYTETKPRTGKVAPTWNYAAVQVYGRATVYHDSKSEETDVFLSTQLRDLSRFTEEQVMGFTGQDGAEEPWRIEEAPEGYLSVLKKNIVGIRIDIERIDGKFKMSQERPTGDRDGVVKGFRGLGTQAGNDMAELVHERGKLKDQRA